MTDRHRTDSRLDAAIDRAVRDMMSAEPRADLRERVMADLAGASARATLWPRFALGSAALAAAAVLIVVLINRPAERGVEQTIAQSPPAASAPSAPERTPGATAPGAGLAPKTVDRGPAATDRPLARTVAPGPAVEDRLVQAASIGPAELIAIEPMARVERLQPIAPIEIATLGAAQAISPTPISIEPIDITPLTPPR